MSELSNIIKAAAAMVQSLSAISENLKRDVRIIEEIAEKMDIKNKVRAKKAERKISRIDRKLKN